MTVHRALKSLGVAVPQTNMGVSENRGTLFWGPYNKDPSI